MKLQRQGLNVSIKELANLIEELIKDYKSSFDNNNNKMMDSKFLVGIINKEGMSDTWELEK